MSTTTTMYECNSCGKVDSPEFLLPSCRDCGSSDTRERSRASSIMDHYLYDLEGFSLRGPSTEEGHTKRCLAEALICAVENVRDSDDFTDTQFVGWAQLNGPLLDGRLYLDDGLVECKCPPVVEEDMHYFQITSYKSGHRDSSVRWGRLTDLAAHLASELDYGLYDTAAISYVYETDQPAPFVWMASNYAKVLGIN